VRPPEGIYPDIELKYLLHETTVVALPADHPLTALDVLSVSDLIDVPLIVPARRARPQSYDLTMKLFAEAGMRPRIAQQADEKQTIVSLVAAGAGSAIVPRWTSRMMGQGVVFRPLDVGTGPANRRLPWRRPGFGVARSCPGSAARRADRQSRALCPGCLKDRGSILGFLSRFGLEGGNAGRSGIADDQHRPGRAADPAMDVIDRFREHLPLVERVLHAAGPVLDGQLPLQHVTGIGIGMTMPGQGRAGGNGHPEHGQFGLLSRVMRIGLAVPGLRAFRQNIHMGRGDRLGMKHRGKGRQTRRDQKKSKTMSCHHELTCSAMPRRDGGAAVPEWRDQAINP
jgi:hypothetical protein